MALDMERPSSVHSPEAHSLSGGSSLGVLPVSHHHSRRPTDDHRSSSPEGNELRPSIQPVQGLIPPSHSLKFSIEKILSPDFGRRDATRERRNSITSNRELPSIEVREKNHSKNSKNEDENSFPQKNLYPAWIFCTRYSDRPSSGPRRIRSKQIEKSGSSSARQEYNEDDQSPRSRRMKKKEKKPDEKRPRTAFTAEQLARLKQEFTENRYLTEKRRQDLARDLRLNESQIKIWFQNKRAKIKKANPQRNPLALQLMAQGLYNHSTVPLRDDEDEERPKSSSSS